MVAVHSSNIAAIGYDQYDDDKGNLFVLFHNGGFYVYRKVPKETAMELVNAPSIGQYLARSVKDVYRFEQIDTPDGLLDKFPKRKEAGAETIPWNKLKANKSTAKDTGKKGKR